MVESTWLKALGCPTIQQVESTSLSKFWFSDVVNLHAYAEAEEETAARIALQEEKAQVGSTG